MLDTTPDEPLTSSPSHREWLSRHARALVDFAGASVRSAGGFWWLDSVGRPDTDEPVHTWISCRMTYVYALASLQGDMAAGVIADHGVTALAGLLRDHAHDGWYASVRDDRPLDGTKAAYPHAFVVLALSAATIAGRPGAAELLDEALVVILDHFWDDEAGRTRESYSADWLAEEQYRGANSSMHMVEAFLAAGDATGDTRWFERAERIAAHLIHDVAAGNDWRLPEHFTADWEPQLNYHADSPNDQFRPYGSTIGHWLEWSRLLLHIEVARGADAPAWLATDAIALFTTAIARGWAVDGADGFIYTIAWDDSPVVRTRMHWVVAEAIAAAAVLRARTGDPWFDGWYRRFWDYAQRHLIDTEHGSWHHELDTENRPAPSTWLGKPDIYHCYQATLIPLLPLAPSLAQALAPTTRAMGSSIPVQALAKDVHS